MSKPNIYAIISFVFTVLFTILILPHLHILFRPNLILVFIILFSFNLGFQNSIWFWIIGGIILDSFISSYFPINSVIFIGLFALLLLFSKLFDYSTKMSKIVTAFILISIYYLSWFFIGVIFLKQQNNDLFIYLLETLILFALIFKIKNKDKRNEKTFQNI
jgi:rod shape-determining protein MreD